MNRPSSFERPDPVSADEAAADDARRRLREQGIVALEPDARIGVMLAPGESVVAVRRGVSLERRKDVDGPGQALHCDLYVTTTRLVCLGQMPVDIPLAEIREVLVAVGMLRLAIRQGRGLEIRIEDPYLLRVEIAAARESARSKAAGPRPLHEAPDSALKPVNADS